MATAKCGHFGDFATPGFCVVVFVELAEFRWVTLVLDFSLLL